MNDMLHIEGLTKRYDGFTLDHVSFTLKKGTIMGLIGENGAGKSTTIKAILDLIHKDEGTVTFQGQDLAADRLLREDVGVVLDGMGFYEHMTPERIGKVCKAAYRQWDAALYGSYLKRFSLPEKKAVKELSRGMRVKLNIAIALSHRPKLLLLDEATSGLDPVMRDDILEIFLDFVQDEEHAILMSSHISADLEKVADYITFIHEGRVLFSREKDELRYQWGVLRCGAEQFARLDPADVMSSRKEACQYSVLVADKEVARRRYPEAVIDDATIDEIMLIFVKGGRKA